jgi:hypothetical protein
MADWHSTRLWLAAMGADMTYVASGPNGQGETRSCAKQTGMDTGNGGATHLVVGLISVSDTLIARNSDTV